MKKLLLIPIILSGSILLNASDDVEQLAVEKCNACHLIGPITKEKLKRMSAPPYWALAKKVKTAYPNKNDAINFFVDYIFNPSAEKMLFPKETKERFGVMPSQKGALSEDEARAIAIYILEHK